MFMYHSSVSNMVDESKLPFLLEESWPILRVLHVIGISRLRKVKDMYGNSYLQPMAPFPYLMLWLLGCAIFNLPSYLGVTYFCYGSNLTTYFGCVRKFQSSVSESTTDLVSHYIKIVISWSMHVILIVSGFQTAGVVPNVQDCLKSFTFTHHTDHVKTIMMHKLKQSLTM